WMESFAIARKKADMVELAFREVIGQSIPSCEIQLAEARVKAQIPVGEGVGLAYLTNRLMGAGSSDLANLGNVSFLGLRYEIVPAEFSTESALAAPCREVTVEPLRD